MKEQPQAPGKCSIQPGYAHPVSEEVGGGPPHRHLSFQPSQEFHEAIFIT